MSKPVAEKPLEAKVAAGTGYSESKWVSESILSTATREAGVPTVSVRVGQMTGAVSGAWNAQEWVPSLLKSSIYLGCVPVLDKVNPYPLFRLRATLMLLLLDDLVDPCGCGRNRTHRDAKIGRAHV